MTRDIYLLPKSITWLIYSLTVFLPIQTPILNWLLSRGWPKWLSLWKELIVFILLIFLVQALAVKFYCLLQNKKLATEKLGKASVLFVLVWQILWQYFWPTCTLFLLTIWILLTSRLWNHLPWSVIALGFRFELWWLWFFTLSLNFWQLYQLPTNFLRQLKFSIYLGFLPVMILSLASLLLGQVTVLEFFAYRNNGAVGVNLCDSVDFGLSKCRLSAGFASPNHFAGYLLLVLPVFLSDTLKLDQRKDKN